MPSASDYDLDALYSQSSNNCLKLFRLMQRTAPVISHLSQSTLEALLERFSELMTQNRGIRRILPWLWQLTEPSQNHRARILPLDLKEKLLSTLSSLAADATEEPEQSEQIKALNTILQRLWTSPQTEEDLDRYSRTDHDDRLPFHPAKGDNQFLK